MSQRCFPDTEELTESSTTAQDLQRLKPIGSQRGDSKCTKKLFAKIPAGKGKQLSSIKCPWVYKSGQAQCLGVVVITKWAPCFLLLLLDFLWAFSFSIFLFVLLFLFLFEKEREGNIKLCRWGVVRIWEGKLWCLCGPHAPCELQPRALKSM